MSSVTGAVVEFARTATYDPGHRDAIVRSLVDTVGVAAAGFDTDTVAALDRWLVTEPSAGPAVVWGRGGTVSSSQAALINGTAAHALDFDDAIPGSPMHPSTVLWPAVLAQACTDAASWTHVFAAVEVGNSAIRTLIEALPGEAHYARSWHTTSTVGRLGAVAALIRLLGLDEPTARHALGIAASTAAGSLANFGSMTKPLHAGLAARDAIAAVGLARAGFTAHVDQLDAPGGFLSQYGEHDPDRWAAVPARLTHWAGAWPTDISVKRYPSCYGTHRAIDAALVVRARVGPDAAHADRILVEIHPSSLRPLIDHVPTSPLEAKFSLEHTVATALLDGSLDLDSFTPASIHRPDLVELRNRVEVVASPTPPNGPDLDGAGYARVTVTASGVTDQELVTLTRGDARNPLEDVEREAKFLACTDAAGWSGVDALSLLSALLAAGTTDDMTETFSALRREQGQQR